MSDMLELDDKVHALQMDMELARKGAEMGEELAEELARNRAKMAPRAHASGTLFSALFSSMSFLIVVTCISLCQCLSLSAITCNALVHHTTRVLSCHPMHDNLVCTNLKTICDIRRVLRC